MKQNKKSNVFKTTLRVSSAALASLMLIGMLPFVGADGEPSEKEEVIYVNLSADGTKKEMYAVNIFAGGDIVDYGEYSEVELLNTTDKISSDGDKISFSTSADRVYYKGKLTDAELPWDITVRYILDGTELTAEEVAGKDGKLEIKIEITKNDSCAGNFYDTFALQAAVVLNTEKCSSIVSDGATVANVGRNKQLTYTVLPGNGADITISADVTDFEMESISINGLKLNLNIEMDDEFINDKIDEIIGAVQKLDEGAGAVKDGAEEVKTGSGLLKDAAQELYEGTGELNTGAAELKNGLAAITSQNSELINGAYSAFQGLCDASETVLNTLLTQNGMGAVDLTPETYTQVLGELIGALDADNVYSTAYDKALAEVTSGVEAKADELYAGYIDTIADSVYVTYVQSQAAELNSKVAAQAVLEQLIAGGYTNAQATAYLQTAEGKALITKTVSAMTDAQKKQILTNAVAGLTAEQKKQIKAGAVSALTADQKKQIKAGYIDDTMKSAEVTGQINAAVSAADAATASIAELKGKLDSYSYFYEGLRNYTSAVSNAASGAASLSINMETLYKGVGELDLAVGDLDEGVKALFDGATELKDGTKTFADKTADIDSAVSEEINSMLSSISGGDAETGSFVSEKNTKTDSVQFVIKTEAVEAETEMDIEVQDTAEHLTFWQKLLRLFGLY